MLSQDQLVEIQKALEAATPGPWKVYETIYENDKPFLAERQIGTVHHHPQLKAPDTVVTMSTCAFEPHHRVYISEEDAHLIANTPTWIQQLLETVRSKDSEIEDRDSLIEALRMDLQGVQVELDHTVERSFKRKEENAEIRKERDAFKALAEKYEAEVRAKHAENETPDQEQKSAREDSRFMTITKFAWDEKVSNVKSLKAALAIAVEALEWYTDLSYGGHRARQALDRINSKEDKANG